MLKKISAIIFVCAVLSFTACGDKSSTPEPSLADETRATEESMENTTEDIADVEMDDEEYLINLGKQLERGMTVDEVIDKIGEPDEYLGSGILYLGYCRGDLRLYIMVGSSEGSVRDVMIMKLEQGELKPISSEGL